MTPATTAVRMTGAAHREELPLLVLGPALGTSAATLWRTCAAGLTDAFDVLAWDLPGHGHNRSVPDEPWDVADLARGVLAVIDDVLAQRGEVGGPFAYAGVSVGGAVGLQLLLDVPARVDGAVLLSTGARMGTPELWADRVERVRASGTAAVVTAAAERWFAPDFLDRRPSVGSDLLVALQETVDEGYVQVCRAIADLDVRDRLAEVTAPVLAVAGAVDVATPAAHLEEIVAGVRDGRLVVLPDVAHLPPAEAPEAVAALVREHLLGETAPSAPAASVTHDDRTERHEVGTVVRREVLGDDHVDRALGEATDFTDQFQELVTDHVWGGIWARPGLDRRSRSLVALTALVAQGHHEELAAHVRAALRNGLTVEEIRELLLQTAVYCGVPASGAAFRVAQEVLAEEGLA
ncbi:alpha/beta fold hydrolase [Nocardioides sp. CPCC 205120]|uniref:bifunctional 3-oxoadipate enol-lactonase/4-carboxymuconolactone decarboxylase PcaDC n=1 Tax=Nocardioides sp. CPCC 205120 TaxID=3406462 RepID=UPI003B504600